MLVCLDIVLLLELAYYFLFFLNEAQGKVKIV